MLNLQSAHGQTKESETSSQNSTQNSSQTAGRIKFPRQFLVQSAIRDYQDITRAILREFLQNSRDAKATRIDFIVQDIRNGAGEERVAFECRDNGIGMDRNVIENKLMAMGGTTKEGDNDAVGAMGVAKLACYFCHDDYMISTREWRVDGSGSDYSVYLSPSEAVRGCHARVVLNPLVVSRRAEELASIYRAEIARSYLPHIAITVNGQTVEAAAKAGRRVHDFDCGVTVHKKPMPEGKLTSYVAVRARGLFLFDMYVHETRYDMSVEMQGYSAEILTSNRDGFRSGWSSRVSALIQQMNLNSSMVEKSQVHHYRGQYSRSPAQLTCVIRLVNDKLTKTSIKIASLSAQEAAAWMSENDFQSETRELALKEGLSPQDSALVAEAAVRALESQAQGAAADESSPVAPAVQGDGHQQVCGVSLIREEDLGVSSRRHHYYVETKGKFRSVPAKWREENLSRRHRTLLETWAEVVGLVIAHSGRASNSFDVGFILDDGTDGQVDVAAYARIDGRSVFLLNPLTSGGDDSQMPLTRAGRLSLVMYLKALAEHEVTHFAGKKWHDEAFTSAEMELRRKTARQSKAYLELAKKKSQD